MHGSGFVGTYQMRDFILNPSSWMLAILWMSLGYAMLRLFLKLSVIRKMISAGLISYWHKVPIGFPDIFGMVLRRVDPVRVVSVFATAERAELGLKIVDLESHVLAGGDPGAVVQALCLAKEHDMQLEFIEACAIQLSGKDVVAEIRKALGISERSVQDFLKDKKR